MSKLRRREVIPEDTNIRATLNDPKLVYGQYNRQIEAVARVTDGEYKGTEFKNWFSFGKDKETGEEFISYGGPLYQAFLLVESQEDIDAVLDDEDLTDKKYEQFIKQAIKKLNGIEIVARVGVKAPKSAPEKKRNFLQPGTFGLYEDPEEGFDELDMSKKAS
jgi:hypothetical protein